MPLFNRRLAEVCPWFAQPDRAAAVCAIDAAFAVRPATTSVTQAVSGTREARTGETPGGSHVLQDILELLRYKRELADHQSRLRSMTRPGMPLPEAMNLTYWSAANTPIAPKLSEDAVFTLPLYHWLVAAARSHYQSDLNEHTFRLLVGLVSIRTGRSVTDLMALPVAEFDSLRAGVPAAPSQSVPVPDVVHEMRRSTGGQSPDPLARCAAGLDPVATDPTSDQVPGSVPVPPTTPPPSKTRKLTDRRKLILTEMLAMGAVGNTKKTTRAEVVRRIDKKKTASDFAHDFGALKTAKYTDSDLGPEGGVWLTGAGKTKAEELDAENR